MLFYYEKIIFIVLIDFSDEVTNACIKFWPAVKISRPKQILIKHSIKKRRSDYCHAPLCIYLSIFLCCSILILFYLFRYLPRQIHQRPANSQHRYGAEDIPGSSPSCLKEGEWIAYICPVQEHEIGIPQLVEEIQRNSKQNYHQQAFGQHFIVRLMPSRKQQYWIQHDKYMGNKALNMMIIPEGHHCPVAEQQRHERPNEGKGIQQLGIKLIGLKCMPYREVYAEAAQLQRYIIWQPCSCN